jgi:hypothetical protein
MAPSFLKVPQHLKRVDEKGTDISIPNALFNCNPLRMKREGYFLKSFLCQ